MTADFRSDTLTRPTKEMLAYMMQASVGDDVFEEDPTINRLEEKAAQLFGMQKALFCPSGTMTNQIAIKVHTRPGDEVICDQTAHVYRYEGGGIAFNSGASVRLIEGAYGQFTVEDLKANINPDNVHFPHSSLLVIENTSNKGGGSIWQAEEIRKMKAVCNEPGIKMHLDGARLFNALAETGDSPALYGELFDSISICLSKGLGAPVGSLLIGDEAFIYQARRVRKVLGGGMRQAGYLAAAGIYALDYHRERLKEDHRKAKALESVLSDLSYVKKVFPVQTNILVFELIENIDDTQFISRMEQKGIRMVSFGPQLIRMVTHLDITDEMMEDAIRELKVFLK